MTQDNEPVAQAATTNVVPLRGSHIAVGIKQPDDGVVKTLERALQLARDGEVIGVAITMQHHDAATSYDFVGKSGRAFLGTLAMMVAEVTEDTIAQEDQDFSKEPS